MKAASSRTRTRKFLALAATTLAATLAFGTQTARADDPNFTYPDGFPKLGAPNEGVHGLNVNYPGGKTVPTQLFSVHTSSANDGTIKAYCVELDVGVKYRSDLTVGDWKDFPGTNKFKDNTEVQSKVAWIAQLSYPQTDIKLVAKAAGVEGLTEKEAITATQSAIWHFTNKFEFQGTTNTDEAVSGRVAKLYNYLIGEQNVGLRETARPTVDFRGSKNISVTAENTVGPIRFESNQRTVQVTNKLEYELIDAQGSKVDLAAVPTNTDLFLKVPAGASSGEQKFDVSATGSVYAGKLLITKGATADNHGQTIIIGSNTDVTVQGTASFKWQATPAATSTPSESPTPSQSATPSTNSTPSTAATSSSSAADPGDPQPITPTATVTVTAPASSQPSTSAKPGLPKTGSN